MGLTHARASPKDLILWECVTNVRQLDNVCNAADIPYRSEGIALFEKMQNVLEISIGKEWVDSKYQFREKLPYDRRSNSKEVKINN